MTAPTWPFFVAFGAMALGVAFGIWYHWGEIKHPPEDEL